MAVQLDRALSGGAAEVRRELADTGRGQETPRVLEVEPVHVGAVGERRGALRVVRMRVHFTDRVGETDHDLLGSLFAEDLGHAAQPLRVVRGVGDLEATNAVAHDAAEHEPHQVLVAGNPGDEAHAGRDEGERCVRHRHADEPDSLPRILLLEPHGDRHVRARGEVDGVESDPIHRRRDLEDVRSG